MEAAGPPQRLASSSLHATEQLYPGSVSTVSAGSCAKHMQSSPYSAMAAALLLPRQARLHRSKLMPPVKVVVEAGVPRTELK